MQAQHRAGRQIVAVVIVATLTVSVLAIVAFNMAVGPRRLPQQIVRFLLEIGLCIYLYRGANWARWVAIILFLLSGLGSLVAVAVLPSSGNLVVLALGLFYAISAAILLFVPSVRAFFSKDARSAALEDEREEFET